MFYEKRTFASQTKLSRKKQKTAHQVSSAIVRRKPFWVSTLVRVLNQPLAEHFLSALFLFCALKRSLFMCSCQFVCVNFCLFKFWALKVDCVQISRPMLPMSWFSCVQNYLRPVQTFVSSKSLCSFSCIQSCLYPNFVRSKFPISSLSCAPNFLCTDFPAFKNVYVQNFVCSNQPMSKLSCVQCWLCPDFCCLCPNFERSNLVLTRTTCFQSCLCSDFCAF